MRIFTFKRRLNCDAALTAIGISLLASAAPAFAQQAEPQVSGQPAGADAAIPPTTASEIVVTGSRIARRDFQANSPLVTVSEDAFENRASVGVEDALNELPQFTPAGSGALSSSAGTAFTGPDQAPGAATLDLRALGTNRTLVLVNGRRAQPVNGQLVVDVNTIPSAAIRSVEVITGGAAAVYGADAIAGVVNFILRDDFEGLEVDAQAGVSEHGDAETYRVSGLFGGNFADGRGNAMVGVMYSKREASYNNRRDFYRRGWNDPMSSAAGGSLPLNGATVGAVSYGVNFDGSLFRLNDAANPAAPFKGPLNSFEGGAGYKLNPPNSAGQRSLGFNDPDGINSIPLERYSLFASAHYDITDNITAFVEGNYTHSWAYAQSISGTASNIWTLNVPYNAANDDPDSPTFGADQRNFYPVARQLADLLNARPTNPAGVPGTQQPWQTNRGLNFLNRLYIETTSDIFQLTAGLRGEVGIKDWTWEVYGSHGNTQVIARQPEGAISHEYLQQLISGTTSTGARSPTINGPWSQGWTSGATFNPSSCTSGIPLFNADGSVPQPVESGRAEGVSRGEGVVVSQDCKDYATLELNNITMLKQNVVEGVLQGGLFNNWAGEVRFAVGATYRDADFSYAPDSGNSAEQPTTGVINQIALPAPTEGAISVKEAYGELLFPLLSDFPLVQQLDLELGARYSEYALSGGIWTFKALADWEVTDWLRFRGGYQLANRAPNIYELFAPVAGGLGAGRDVCVNIVGQTPIFGNRPDNPNILNLQEACEEAIVRDGGFDYVTLAEDPNAVAQDPGLYPNIDLTRMSNHRWILGYNGAFPFSVALQQGNTDLDSEEADTFTAGMVLRSPISSPLLNRLTLTADYYYIDLKGTIAAPSGTEIYSQCFDPQYNDRMASAPGTYTGAQLLEGNPYCALINRYPFDERGVLGAPGSGTDRTYDAPFLNKGGTRTSGVDITVNWTGDFADMGIGIPGSINFNGTANILLEFKESPFPGAPYTDYKGTLENQAFEYKLFGSLSYLWDKGSIGLRGRYLPSIDPAPTAPPNTFGTDEHTEFDLFARYEVADRVTLRAGIDNLFDAQPEIVNASPINNNGLSTIQVYDTIGRSFYAGINMRM